jgi:hypothetical protein
MVLLLSFDDSTDSSIKTNGGVSACPDLAFVLLMEEKKKKRLSKLLLLAKTAAATGKMPTIKANAAVCHVETTTDQQAQPVLLVHAVGGTSQKLCLMSGLR